MSAELIVDAPSNLIVKYSGCFGLLGNKVIRAIDFRSMDDGENHSIITFDIIDKKSGRSTNKSEPFTTDFSFPVPKLGAINYKDYTLFIDRLHKRTSNSRYRKGLCYDTMEILNPCYFELNRSGRNTPFTNLERTLAPNTSESLFRNIVYDIFFPVEFTFKEAFDKVLSFDRLSAAFGHAFTISLNLASDSFTLSRDNCVIGVLDENIGKFNMLIDIFNEELKSFGVPFNTKGK